MNTSEKLTHCRYCVVDNGRHEADCLITLRGCTQEDVPLEMAYRKGVHQAFAMLDIWLEDRPDIDVRDLIHQARILSREARSDRGPRKWLMHVLLEHLKPSTLTSPPIELIRALMRRSAYAAEHGIHSDQLMDDVNPSMTTRGGTFVGAHVFNAIANLRAAMDVLQIDDPKETT